MQIAYARRRLRIDGPIVSWFSVPIAAPLRSRRLGDRGWLFHHQQDLYDELSGRRRGASTGVDRRAGPRLRRQRRDKPGGARQRSPPFRRAATVLAPHGVDVERFAGDPALPIDIAGLERPLVGYVGIIDDYLIALCDPCYSRAASTKRHGRARGSGQHGRLSQGSFTTPPNSTLGFRPYVTIAQDAPAFDRRHLPV